MKTNHFLAFISLLAITTVARANTSSQPTLVLPTYVVTVPRALPIEQSINTSLEAFRQQNLNRLLATLTPGQIVSKGIRPIHLATSTSASVAARAFQVKS